MIHAVVGCGLRIGAMIMSLGVLRLTLHSGGCPLGKLAVLLHGWWWLLMLGAAGVAGVMLHLRYIVLHVLRYFRHDPARMNEYTNFGHLEGFAR